LKNDTIRNDSLEARPLPKWLTDQRDGLNTWQPPKTEMKEDRLLGISMAITGVIILLTLTILTIYFLRKIRKRNRQ
jgi:heme/copper-type cytochrome/quinol oxidase subunit 2